MASLNKVLILGNLGADPDVRHTESRTTIATLSVATNRRYNNRDNQPVTETEWHRVVLFGRQAELAQQYLRKGNGVFIEGRLRTRKWTDQNGQDRWTTEIICENMQFVGGREDGANGDNRATPVPSTSDVSAVAPAGNATENLTDDVPF